MRRRRSYTPFVAVLAPLLLVVGIWLGGHPGHLPGFARDALVGDDQGRLVDEALDDIAENYYRPVDKTDLANKGLTASVKSLDDRFSNYFDPKEYKSFEESTAGEFEGVGMSVAEVDRGLRVVTVYEGSPAKKGGIKEGDTVVAVNGKSLAGESSEQATTLIKGPAGSAVTLSVESAGVKAARDVRLQRAKVDVPVVESTMETAKDGTKIGRVALSSFTSGAHGEVRKGVDAMLGKGAEGIVLDLRDNGGGLLNEAVLISSIFIGDGTIVSTEGRNRPRRVFEATGHPIDPDIPVVVLVNGNSASASEIVTGALQDRGRAEIVGTHTFGKGVFQEIRELSNGGALDITVGEYFTPKGRNLGGGGVKQGAGIQPDVLAKDDPKTPKVDEGLDKAVATVAREAS